MRCYILLLILPAIIMADRFEDTAKEMFQYVDSDKNGIATIAEMHTYFQGFDRPPKDGVISHKEFTNYFDLTIPDLHFVANHLFDIFDANSDQNLTMDDFDLLHKVLDGDRNGELSMAEWVRYWSYELQEIDYLLPSNV